MRFSPLAVASAANVESDGWPLVGMASEAVRVSVGEWALVGVGDAAIGL